jgi:hypothetical protein
VDLVFYAAAFTLWQCTTSLPRSGAAIVSFLGHPSIRRGPGYHLFSPWPGDLGCLVEEADTPHAFALTELRATLEAARRASQPLRVACELYVLFVFVATPAAIAWLGSEAAWRLALPAIGALHVGTLATLMATEWRYKRCSHGRIDRWISSVLFPPALFRTPADLLAQRLAGFHPATVAAALLDEAAFVRVLRTEIGRLEVAARPCESMLGLCEQLGIDRRRVTAPARVDPDAESFCPRCLDEFRVERGHCLGCDADSIPYEVTS